MATGGQPEPQALEIGARHLVPTLIPLPPNLDMRGNLSVNWKKFKRMWDNYEIASGLNDKPMKLRTTTLLTCIGSEAFEIFDGLSFDSEEDKSDIDKVTEKFENFCVGRTNVTYERYTFNKRDQEPNENIDAYVAALRSLAKTCKFEALVEEMIRDRIVIGIRNNGTRRKLLQEPQLTLQKCIDLCRANEKSETQLKVMEEVQAIKHKGDKHKFNTKKVQPAKSKVVDCQHCGTVHMPYRKEHCPAWGKKCLNCSKLNHFAKQCMKATKTRKSNKPRKTVHKVDTSSDEEFVLTVATEPVSTENTVNKVDVQKRLYAVMNIQGENIEFQLDCGSTVNVLPEKFYRKLFSDMSGLCKANVTLIMFNKTETEPLGKRRLTVRNPKNRKKYNIEFVIVAGNVNPILGSRAIQALKLVTVNRKNFVCAKELGSENVTVITKQHLVKGLTLNDIETEFSDIFEGQGRLKGKLHLEVDKSVTPTKIPPRRIPVAMKEPVKQELARLTDLGIITAVDQPTDWISSMVAVKKPNGKLRLCIDPKPLNKALKRNHYNTPTIDDILPQLNKARVFSVVDTKNGFWHVELDHDSSFLTTFGTPWGRYRWLRMPFGISPAPEEFQRRLDEALEGVPGVKAIHDDIVVYGCGDSDDEAAQDHDVKLRALFKRCREQNIKLNKDKLKLRLSAVNYLGHIISADGLRVDPSKVKAIAEMPPPTDKAGVQRLLGMVNYLQKFAPNLSRATAPLRGLLKQTSEFVWEDSVHGEAFREIQHVLSRAPVLAYFDPAKPTVLQCDASENGLGASLMQEGQPVTFASRSLTSTEANYAQIEKELLAVLFGMERFEHYTYGRHIVVESDHKPLEIICKKGLTTAPKRLQRMLLRLQKFDFEVVYKKGKEMYLADTLSRAYLPEQEQALNDDIIFEVAVSIQRLNQIREATARDETLHSLKFVIQRGWPGKLELSNDLQCYHNFRDELVVQDGLILKGDRVVIPQSLRQEMIDRVHSSHIGIQNCLRRARETIFWPNMSRDIEQRIKTCEICNSYSMEQKREPLITHEIPERPWEKVGCDLFELDGKNYLITVDYYSDFFEVDRLHDKTSKEVIIKLKAHMARHGIPDTLVSDNGPPFNSRDFQSFADLYEFEHVTSSPLYAQSNGKVENSVKIVKRLMKKSIMDRTDPYLALLDWRNTPTEHMESSSVQRLFGRRTKTRLPTSKNLLVPNTERNVKDRLFKRKAKATYYYNRGVKELPGLQPGETVRVKPHGKRKTWTKAYVDRQIDIRSYEVRTEYGQVYRRNRKHLKRTTEPYINQEQSSAPTDPKPTTIPPVFESDKQPKISMSAQTDDNEVLHDQDSTNNEIRANTCDETEPPLSTPRYPKRQTRRPSKFRDYDVEYSV